MAVVGTLMVIVGVVELVGGILVWLFADASASSPTSFSVWSIENAFNHIAGGFFAGSVGIGILWIWHQKEQLENRLETLRPEGNTSQNRDGGDSVAPESSR